MKNDINLLPPEKKKKLKYISTLIFAKKFLEAAFAIFAFLAVGAIWSWVILQNRFSGLDIVGEQYKPQQLEYNREIRNLNHEIKEVNQASNSFSPVTPKILDFIQNLPPEIKITSLNIDKEKKIIAVKGVALTRDDLLNYMEEIKKISWIIPPSVPVSKLIKKENINFEFSAPISI